MVILRSNLVQWLLPVFLSFSGAACGRTAEPPPVVSDTRITSAELAPDDAIIRVAAGRCDHELACQNVGPGRRFESGLDCIQVLGRQTRGELLRVDRCRGRIDEASVDDCLLDVKYASCGMSVEHLDRFRACRRALLTACR